ncbi:MAG: hypothetical protein H8E14_02705 [Candidatus Marinimicrobia bacterium]|nr:hypothetical protein [Candidatus Neomarinimicrobiota bacterium]
MNRTKYYSGMQPALEDLLFEQISKEEALRNRISDFFTNGVLTGLQISIENNAIYLQPGIGYVNGERIQVVESSQVSDTIQDGFVFIKFIQTESEPESHFITGDIFNTRITDSFESLFTMSDEPQSNGLLLAEIQSGFIIDKRTFIELNLSKPGSVIAPSNLTVTTGFESELNYSSNQAS